MLRPVVPVSSARFGDLEFSLSDIVSVATNMEIYRSRLTSCHGMGFARGREEGKK